MKRILQNYLLPSIEGDCELVQQSGSSNNGGQVRWRVFFYLFILPLLTFAQSLPMDPAVRYGQLDNGLTYYICPNKVPTGQAEYYIVQRVGSILEEEEQRGLAHFLEHMAFNGTKNFPKKRLIEYLEENGVRFGTDINAYTSFDHTVYNLSHVPTHREGLIDSCLLILHDWSGFITLDGKEIDAERKVIHEEWRMKTGARERIYEQTLPKLFPDGNRYAHRMPIGLMEVVDNFPHKALRDYYHRWYRPNLQAIIIAGDVNADYVEQRIHALWKDIPLKKDAPERPYFTVADNETPIVAIGTDKELTSGTLRISYKYDPHPQEANLTMEGQKENLCRQMVLSMLMNRLYDEAENSTSNLYFSDGDYSLSMTKKALSAHATFRNDQWKDGMKGIVYQLKRVMEHGFTTEEFARSLNDLRKSLESLQGNTHTQSNSSVVQKCMAHYLYSSPLLSLTEEVKLYHQLIQQLTLKDVNNRFNQFIYSQGGIAILLQGQEREGNNWPTEAEVLQAYGEAWSQQTTAYRIPETEPAPELMPIKPTAGSIVKETKNKEYDTHELTLSNGAKVILKPTVNKDQYLELTAISLGGTSLISDSEYIHINAINALPPMGGLAHLSGRDLGRAMEGSSASYQTNVSTLYESFSGGSLWSDTEDLLQLMHLRFTTVRKDTTAFLRWQSSNRNNLVQRMENPMTHFSDTLRSVMYEPHPRNRKATLALADSVDYDRTCTLFQERFANAADFTFIFVGHMDIDSIRPLICQYIASLPGNEKAREIANLKALPTLRRGRHTANVHVPMEEPVTTVIYNILAKERYTAKNNIACAILSEVMNSLCTETLREQEGGTYNVSVTSRISRQPTDELTLMFNFNTNPQQAQSLLQKAIGLLHQVADEGPSTPLFNKAKEYLLKQHASYRDSDSFWMAALTEHVRYHSDDMLTNGETLQKVTPKDVQRLARKLIRSKHTVEVVMNP